MISREIQQSEEQQGLLERTRTRKEEWNSMVEFESPRKRVRISSDGPLIHHFETPRETASVVSNDAGQVAPRRNRTWLTRQELGYFRSCAKKLCRTQNLDDVLRSAYRLACEFETKSSALHAETLADNEAYVAQRGLERWSSSQHALVRAVKILEVRSAVFLEQSSQCLSGKRNPGLLAKVSREASQASQKFAHLLASTDATIAMRVREEHYSSHKGQRTNKV